MTFPITPFLVRVGKFQSFIAHVSVNQSTSNFVFEECFNNKNYDIFAPRGKNLIKISKLFD